MGAWADLGDDIVDYYLNGDEEDMKEFSEIIQKCVGCHRCKVFDFCYEYKDEVFDGECYKVLTSFFCDTEDEDTEEYRKEREEEARRQEAEDWHSWYNRD